MRGKAMEDLSEYMESGITPAYAGKRILATPSAIRYWDHPRLCGEKRQNVFALKFKTGSPPPMRGKGYTTLDKCPEVGITPAYAGKSS